MGVVHSQFAIVVKFKKNNIKTVEPFSSFSKNYARLMTFRPILMNFCLRASRLQIYVGPLFAQPTRT